MNDLVEDFEINDTNSRSSSSESCNSSFSSFQNTPLERPIIRKGFTNLELINSQIDEEHKILKN